MILNLLLVLGTVVAADDQKKTALVTSGSGLVAHAIIEVSEWETGNRYLQNRYKGKGEQFTYLYLISDIH